MQRPSDSRAAGNPLRGVCFLLSHSLLSVLPCPRLAAQTPPTIVCENKHTETTQTCVYVCVFRFQPDVSPDDPAQPAGRQQQSERWASCSLCSTSLFSIHLTLCVCVSLTDSAWQYGSPGFQELKAEVTEVPAPDSSEGSTGLFVLEYHSGVPSGVQLAP